MMGNDNGPKSPRYAQIVSRLVAPPDRDHGIGGASDRAQTVQALAAALQARALRASRRRRLTTAAVAAGILGVGIGVLTVLRSGDPSAITARVDSGGSLRSGSVVQSKGDRTVSLSLSTGTRLRLSGGGGLRVAELGDQQRFVLQGGRIWAKVAPLSPGQRFLVTTPDTEVEVRGTAFEVAVVPPRAECDGAATEVRVLEGLVTVRRNGQQWQVAGGQRWPRDCDPPVVPERPVDVESRAAVRSPAARGALGARASAAAPRPPTAAPASAPGSTLAEQNDLFAAAMHARLRGDNAEARRQLDALLARFPFGPLAESARSERAKLPAPTSTTNGGP